MRSTGSTKERAQKNKTSNPKHDFKGCPKTRPAVQTGPDAWCVVGTGRVLDYSYDGTEHLSQVVADGDLVARIERDLAARTVRAHGPGRGPTRTSTGGIR